MEFSWPNILRIVSNLEGKLGRRVSVLEEWVFAAASTNPIELDDVHLASEEMVEGNLGHPDVVITEADSRLCPTISRDGGIQARVSAIHRALLEMEMKITDIQQQLATDENRFEACDWDSQALSESVKDFLLSLRHEVETREKQVAIIGHHLSGTCRQRDELQMRVDQLAYRVDLGFPHQLPDAVAATEIIAHEQDRLAGRVERLEADKLGSRFADIQVAEVLQQMSALGDEVRSMHRIYEQHNETSRKVSERMAALENQTSVISRFMRLQLEAIHHDGQTAEEASMSQPTFHEVSISDLGDSISKQQAFFDAQHRLKGKVSRLVKQFGGSCMEEEAAETCCDSHRTSLSVFAGTDESNGEWSSRSGATTQRRTTSQASSARLANHLQEEQQQQQQQSQQRLVLDMLTSRGYGDSTQSVSSQKPVPCLRSPLPVKAIRPSPVRRNSRAPNPPRKTRPTFSPSRRLSLVPQLLER